MQTVNILIMRETNLKQANFLFQIDQYLETTINYPFNMDSFLISASRLFLSNSSIHGLSPGKDFQHREQRRIRSWLNETAGTKPQASISHPAGVRETSGDSYGRRVYLLGTMKVCKLFQSRPTLVKSLCRGAGLTHIPGVSPWVMLLRKGKFARFHNVLKILG